MASRIIRLMAVVAALMALAQASSRADYTVTDLGPMSTGVQGHGNAINASGMVVGTNYNGSLTSAFYVASGSQNMAGVATLGGSSNTALAVNDQGQITGSSQLVNGAFHAYVTTSNGITDLGTITGSGTSTGYAINNSGVVVGQSTAATGSHAFMTTANGMQDLGTLAGGTNSAAYGINASGHVVGISQVSLAGQQSLGTHGFYFDGTSMHDIGGFSTSLNSYAQAINASNHVVGYAINSQGNAQAFIDYQPGVSNSLQALVAFSSVTQSLANGINDSDEVVGEALMSTGVYHAFLWTPSGGMVDLNNFLPAGSNWVLNDATSINDAGQITGYFTSDPGTSNQEIHAFLFSPTIVPAPPSIVLLAIGGIGAMAPIVSRRIQGRTN